MPKFSVPPGQSGPGIHIYFKTPNVLVFWLELGPRKADLFVKGGASLTGFAAQIPAPYGPIVALIVAAEVSAVKSKLRDHGVWVKFGPTGYMTARTRTLQNRGKYPRPW